MATKKIKATKKSKAKIEKKVVSMPSELPTFTSMPSIRKGISKTGIIAIVLGIIILGILAVNRGLVIAAVVNNKPIFRSSVNSALMSRYGTQTLENMITEQLISDEATKQKVTVSKEEIEAKEQEILASFGGNVTLEEVLSYQGMTKEDFDQQIKLQMQLTKIIGKDITITDDEVTTYITDNPSTLIATESDGMRKEAREAILTQKVSEQLQTWYAALKEKAKVYRFMK